MARERSDRDFDGRRYDKYGTSPVKWILGILGVLVLFTIVSGFWLWFGWRIQLDKAELIPIMNKYGKRMTNDMILAEPGGRGPQLGFLEENKRHFRNPIKYSWDKKEKATMIPNEHVGIAVRRYGETLPSGCFVAPGDLNGDANGVKYKGVVEQPIMPGLCYLSSYEYQMPVEIAKQKYIKPGHRGIVTRLVGKTPEDPNFFTVKEGEIGTQPFLLKEGFHPEYSNPYVFNVMEIDIRSHKSEYEVDFTSKDGFSILVKGTIEWVPDESMLPETFVKYIDERDLTGGIQNIEEKIIKQYARSLLRTDGGKHKNAEFLIGTTRDIIQHAVEKSLTLACAKEGVIIRSFVILDCKLSEEIQQQYQRREIAKRQIDQYKQEIMAEVGDKIGQIIIDGGTPIISPNGELVNEKGDVVKDPNTGEPIYAGGKLAREREKRRLDRETKLGGVRAQIVGSIQDAEKYANVEVTKAEKDLEVATIKLQAAQDIADANRATGLAKASVVVMRNMAEESAIKEKIAPFGDGYKYAQNQLIMKLAPGITSILSNTEGLFADWFRQFTTSGSQQPQK